jgi:phosphate transport system substrate-binding protein
MNTSLSLLVASALIAPAAFAAAELTGDVRLDGSSTVYPISEAVGEEFQTAHRQTLVTIGVSGTGGGFKRFCAGETDISNASRPIKPSEVEACAATKIAYIELPIAYDGLAVVVNPANDWLECMTPAELKKLWEPAAQRTVTRWKQIRPAWPDEEIHLFGPGADSGTYDYFAEAIVGKDVGTRGDFQASEDDNVLVQGIAGDKFALGFFGLAYYEENKDKLKLIGIDDGDPDNGAGCIKPTQTTVENGTYQPLSRPLFIYVGTTSAERPEIQAFVDFYFENAAALVSEVGYIPFPPDAYVLVRERFKKRVTGSLFSGSESKAGLTILELLKQAP